MNKLKTCYLTNPISRLLVLSVCGVAIGGCTYNGNASTQELSAQISLTYANTLRVTNNDTFAYDSPEISINRSGLVGEQSYLLHPGSILPGETEMYELTEFAKGDGTRFNPVAIKPTDAMITCNTPKGEKAGIMMGSFKDH